MTGRAVLALAPDASRSGAPRLLASLLARLVGAGEVDPARSRVVVGQHGPLEADLAASAPVRVLGRAALLGGPVAARAHPGARTLGARIGVGLGLAAHPVLRDPGPPDVVWANAAGALPLVAALPRRVGRAPLVAHVHELAIGLGRSLGGAEARRAFDPADVVVAVSGAVRDHLVHDVGLPSERVVVHHGWVPDPALLRSPPPTARRPSAVPSDALVVLACGALGWRKGTDMFLEVAHRLPRSIDGRPVHLVWVGGPARAGDDRRARAEVDLRGLGDRVHLGGEVPDAAAWLAGADVLVHPAREDAFPLAVLEAGALGVPVAGFRSGGIAEALPPEDRDASLADLFDLDGLTGRVEALLADPRSRDRRGSALQARVRAQHDPEHCTRALWADVGRRLGWT